jgi:DNA repair protein RadC
VHPREVFQPAVRDSAAAVILVHNHPSGDPTPSPEDVQLTERLVEAGRILGIRVLDHVVVALGGYASLMDRPPAADS